MIARGNHLHNPIGNRCATLRRFYNGKELLAGETILPVDMRLAVVRPKEIAETPRLELGEQPKLSRPRQVS